MATCKFCSKNIVWVKEGRKNVPIDDDGAKHRCEEMKTAIKSIKHLDRSALSEEEIKRYEDNMNSKTKR